MHLPNLFAIFLLVAVGSASPRPQGGVPSCIDSPYRYGSSCAENGTLTSTSATLSTTTTSSATSTSTGPITAPTAPITVVAARSGSPIHFLRMNAAGLRFYLGQETLSYCPSEVDGVGACPPGNETVFSLCSMAVVVPGGQRVYVTPQGEIGYTQAHSTFMPSGSLPCPFTYYKTPQAPVGLLSTQAFGADGLMACPTGGDTWQVFANMQNATVPQKNVSECLGFDALAIDSTENYAAWQYT